MKLIADKFSTNEGLYNASGKSPFAKLKGKNFMTQNIVAIRKLANGIWFELSYGTGIFTTYILGVTLMDEQGNSFEDVQGCVHEFQRLKIYLQRLNDAIIDLVPYANALQPLFANIMNELRSRKMNEYLRIEYKQGCEVKGVKRYHIVDDAHH
ncbi:hypothetical protein LCGC14_2872660, partial [marine sediment metagenome]